MTDPPQLDYQKPTARRGTLSVRLALINIGLAAILAVLAAVQNNNRSLHFLDTALAGAAIAFVVSYLILFVRMTGRARNGDFVPWWVLVWAIGWGMIIPFFLIGILLVILNVLRP